MPLFEVSILERPTKKEAEDGASEKIVMPITAVVATDKQSAGIIAVMDADSIDVDRSRMQVLVRPFI